VGISDVAVVGHRVEVAVLVVAAVERQRERQVGQRRVGDREGPERAIERVVVRQQALAVAIAADQGHADGALRQGLGRRHVQAAGQRAVADPLRRRCGPVIRRRGDTARG
jgi:hypothetical protein